VVLQPRQGRVTCANVINKLVAGLSQPFWHVELKFPGGDACSIVMHDSVCMRNHTFDPDFYTAVVLRAPPHAVAKSLALAR
jgi:hypothetical protein